MNTALRRIVRLRRTLCTESRSSSSQGVILILGAGKGIGQSVARKFSKNGFHACVVRYEKMKIYHNNIHSHSNTEEERARIDC